MCNTPFPSRGREETTHIPFPLYLTPRRRGAAPLHPLPGSVPTPPGPRGPSLSSWSSVGFPSPCSVKKRGVGGEFSGYRVPPAHFGLVGRAFFPFRAFSPRLRGPSRAPSRPPKLPTNTPSSFASPTRRGGVLVYKQSLLMLVARAHKAKTASHRRRMQKEKRLLYPGKTTFVPNFCIGKTTFVPNF